uniref:Uncharacterized protein n=2 Tax=Rubinisphaera brasiliensis TaxID=119 RepID=F0SNN1_RUBBR|nr:hypothetical protein Plabr_1305 [Rubinisphaera brasiliensis DSM 5305]
MQFTSNSNNGMSKMMRRRLNQTLVGLGHLSQVLAESVDPLHAQVDIASNGLLRHGYKVYSQFEVMESNCDDLSPQDVRIA